MPKKSPTQNNRSNPTFLWRKGECVTVAGPNPNGPKRWRGIPSATKLRNGTMLVAYREGTDHWITPDGVVRICRSTDNGKTWSSPQTIVSSQGRNFGCHLGMVELQNGTILLPLVEVHYVSGNPSYLQHSSRRLISTFFILSYDEGITWTAPQRISLGPKAIWTGSYGNVLVGRESDLIMSVHWLSEGESQSRSGLLRSIDGGHEWGHLTEITREVDDEKSICELPSGRLIAVMRDWDRRSKKSFSDDGGESWTPIQPLPFYGQSPSLLQTLKGVLLCAYRERGPGKPQGVGLSSSYDGGETWTENKPLYMSPIRDCAYPNLLELSQGQYGVVYYTAAIGTSYLYPQIDPMTRDNQNPEIISKTSPELIKYADPDNEIQLLFFKGSD